MFSMENDEDQVKIHLGFLTAALDRISLFSTCRKTSSIGLAESLFFQRQSA